MALYTMLEGFSPHIVEYIRQDDENLLLHYGDNGLVVYAEPMDREAFINDERIIPLTPEMERHYRRMITLALDQIKGLIREEIVNAGGDGGGEHNEA